MKTKINLTTKLIFLFSAIGIIEGCGTRLGHGAVLCSMGRGKIGEFKYSLCTHASVDAWLECDKEVCTPKVSQVSEDMITQLKPHLPVGLYVVVNLETEDYLSRRNRRQNTAKAIADFMTSKNLSYVQFDEFSWHPNFKNTKRRNYLDLVQDMAEVAHKRGWALGIHIELTGNAMNAVYDYEDLSEYVDYFFLAVRRQEVKLDGKYVLGAAYPLTSKNNEGGSYKYALDYVKPYIKPECLLIQIEGGGKRYVSVEKGVDAGPGSLAEPHVNFVGYREICRRNIDDNCSEFWDESASMPFSVCGGSEYFSFENQTSIELKINLAKSYKVSGVHFHWTPDDDEEGLCGLGRMPQVTAMQKIRVK